MKIERGLATVSYRYWTVLVEPGELIAANGKHLPYSAWIGVVRENDLKDGFTIEIWTPTGYKPRGYRDAARVLLTRAKHELEKGGDIATLTLTSTPEEDR